MKRTKKLRLSVRERKAVSMMNDIQRERFFKLSASDQKKLLKQAKRAAGKELERQRYSGANEKRSFSIPKFGDGKGSSAGGTGGKVLSNSVAVAAKVVELTASFMNYMLAESKPEVEKLNEKEQNGVQEAAVIYRCAKKAAVSRGSVATQEANRSKMHAMGNCENNFSLPTSSSAKKSKKRGKDGDQGMSMLRNVFSVVFIFGGLGFFPVILIYTMIISMLIIFDEQTAGYEANVSAKVETYRDLVESACEKYEIDDYVDLVLAMIQQESGGNPPDVMQAEQSYYNTSPPIDSPKESIEAGVQELRDCLKKASSTGPGDIEHISLALQGYNYGNGYIDWVKQNYGGCYTKENALLFSAIMKNKTGWNVYGDPEYVPHVLRYYKKTEDTVVDNKSAQDLIKELMDNNAAEPKVWSLIQKGSSLIGKVTYSMNERQADGRDSPTILDCSSFTAWTFHKSGFSGIPYSSTTATFISSQKFKDISAKDLKPGDIGLKSKTAPTGGANHVGIYCGSLKDGTKIWLHCTSSSGTSLTGNDSGVMMGAYTNFTYFRRLKNFS